MLDQAIEEAEKLSHLMEEKFCREEGYMQAVSSTAKLNLPEYRAVIEADEIEHAEEIAEDIAKDLDPKIKRRMKKAEEALKDKVLVKQLTAKKKRVKVKKLKVLLHKGREKMKAMLTTMTRFEVLQKTLIEVGKRSAVNDYKKKVKATCKEASSATAKMKCLLKSKFFTGFKKKLKKLKKTKPSLKLKPSAKTKPSLKNKDCAVVKAAVKSLLKEKKAKLKVDVSIVKKNKKLSLIKKSLRKAGLKNKLAYIAGLMLM